MRKPCSTLSRHLFTSRSTHLVVFSALLFGLVGCAEDGIDSTGDAGSDADTDTDADADADAGEDGGAFGPASLDDVDVIWFPCSLIEGADDGLAECSSTRMPLFWFADDGRTFTAYAKRLLAPGESTGQLWLLHGGPGASGVIDFPEWMQAISDQHPMLDVYTLDPRGTGYSEFAGCPDQESASSAGYEQLDPSEIPACAAYLDETFGDRLQTIGTTGAAMDLAAYIHHTRENGKRVVVWGGSGGTMWANRFLLLNPNSVDGVIYEGIAPADSSLVFQEEAADAITHTILDACAEDPVCGEKMPDPYASLEEAYANADESNCFFGYDRSVLASVIFNMEYSVPLNALIPSLIYRVARCSAADQTALMSLITKLYPQTGGDPKGFSQVLMYNEVCSELWDHASFATNDDLVDYLDSVYADTILPMGAGRYMNDICVQWPKYSDPNDDQYADIDIPILMLEGVLDPATPYEDAVTLESRYAGEHQTFAAMAYSGHRVAGGSPTSDGGDCGAELFDAFIDDPAAELDLSCMDELAPFDFVQSDGTSAALYGTADAFENDPPAAAPSEEVSRRVREVLADLSSLRRR